MNSNERIADNIYLNSKYKALNPCTFHELRFLLNLAFKHTIIVPCIWKKKHLKLLSNIFIHFKLLSVVF